MRTLAYPGPAAILRAPFDLDTGLLGEVESVLATAAQGFTSAWWLLGQFEVTDRAGSPHLSLPRPGGSV